MSLSCNFKQEDKVRAALALPPAKEGVETPTPISGTVHIAGKPKEVTKYWKLP